ncbi:hypothetical protein SAMN05443574_103315 [Haloarcula vallismortis]|uniref:Uncharacterized protein n=2 Tax=Haloarcula vallismortis TaxID=28442 RepID=M0JT94_HALVA|nr:hypothetical protein [Haloarcula vallismortis]EMA11578.1 hypothetical protein C437_01660 [Haloarcula vallismortis ATCC 29715]SDW45367.1 hypothetical protein SAMN05443574_103315 [Haloarcula vallismortis]
MTREEVTKLLDELEQQSSQQETTFSNTTQQTSTTTDWSQSNSSSSKTSTRTSTSSTMQKIRDVEDKLVASGHVDEETVEKERQKHDETMRRIQDLRERI